MSPMIDSVSLGLPVEPSAAPLPLSAAFLAVQEALQTAARLATEPLATLELEARGGNLQARRLVAKYEAEQAAEDSTLQALVAERAADAAALRKVVAARAESGAVKKDTETRAGNARAAQSVGDQRADAATAFLKVVDARTAAAVAVQTVIDAKIAAAVAVQKVVEAKADLTAALMKIVDTRADDATTDQNAGAGRTENLAAAKRIVDARVAAAIQEHVRVTA
jgi:hypothetical protein